MSDPFVKDTTTSLLVFPSDRTRSKSTTRETTISEAWIDDTTPTDDKQFYSLPHPKPKHADDEYTQG